MDAIGWLGWDRLLFATDYPHWDYDDPAHVLPVPVADDKRRDFFLNNTLKLYRQLLGHQSGGDQSGGHQSGA